MNEKVRGITVKLHLYAGLASGLVLFIVCLTGALYVFRSQIEDALNYDKLYVEPHAKKLPLDSIRAQFQAKEHRINRIHISVNPARSLEVHSSSTNESGAGMFYVNPYSGEILGERNSSLSPFFEWVLSAHKSLLMQGVGKQIVGAAVLIFVFMLISGFVLWLPKRIKELGRALLVKKSEGKGRFLLDLHNVLGFYFLVPLFIIAVMGLYIAYPWAKSTLIVAMGGSPVITQASGQQGEKIKQDLASSFSASLAKIMAQNQEPSKAEYSIDSILQKSQVALPYKGDISLVLPTAENAWIDLVKNNRENFLGAILPDKLEFNQMGELKHTARFREKSLDKQFIALSLPLHTGEFMGWPSLLVYFIASLIGASLPITGTWMWYRRWALQRRFVQSRNPKKSSTPKAATHIGAENALILFATKTGNAKLVAQKAQAQWAQQGLHLPCESIETCSLAKLQALEYLFVAISTHGKGAPPPVAKPFFAALEQQQQHLPKLKYAICALGDTAYPKFCEAGKQLDARLAQLGATPLMPTVLCDAEFIEESNAWIQAIVQGVLPAEQ